MMSSFFRSALFSCLFFGAHTIFAQGAAPLPPGATPPPADDKKPKAGFFRFWNMLPVEAGEIQLVHETGGPEPTVLLAAEPMNVFANYVELKPGRYPLKVVRTADPKTALKTFDVILKANVFVTFFARAENGKLSIEMVDDTYDPEKEVSGKVTFRHLIKDAKVTVKASNSSAPVVLGYGEERVLENLPLKPVVFQMQAALAGGKVRGWTSEIDFNIIRHASLFLVLDVYGRFRPRVTADGQAEVDYSSKH